MSVTEQLSQGDAEAIVPRLYRVYEGAVPPHGAEIQTLPQGLSHVWLLLAGHVTVRLLDGRRETVVARPGQWLINSPTRPRHQQFSPDARLLSLHFTYQSVGLRPIFDAGLPVILAAPAQPQLETRARRALRLVQGVPSPLASAVFDLRLTAADWLALDSAFGGFLAELHRALVGAGLAATLPRSPDPRLAVVVNFLNRSGFVPRMPYDTFARLTGLRRRQLDQLFFAALGLTPRQYRDRHCLQQALALLQDDDKSVKFVTFTLNFRNPSHFIAWFRRQTGLTPRAVARQRATYATANP